MIHASQVVMALEAKRFGCSEPTSLPCVRENRVQNPSATSLSAG
jgi:hypothetical protein